MFDPLTSWAQFQALFGAVLQAAQFLFRIKPGDIEVCNTRIMRIPPSLPWKEQVGIHPLADGRLQITPIRVDPKEKFERDAEADYYKNLKKASRKKK